MDTVHLITGGLPCQGFSGLARFRARRPTDSYAHARSLLARRPRTRPPADAAVAAAGRTAGANHGRAQSEEKRCILETDRLYRLNLREVVRKLRPPVTAQLVTQLLRRGLLLNFIDELPQHRRKSAKDLDAGSVREERCGSPTEGAWQSISRADLPSFEARM